MIAVIKFVSRFILMFASFSSAAEVSQLTMAGDLVIHPAQVKELFELANEKMRDSAFWNWQELQLSRPYHTQWQQTAIAGDLQVKLLTDAVANQEVGFELEWSNPSLRVGALHIDDYISRNVSGHNVEMHIVGQCSDLHLNLPSTQWKARGRMRWAWASSGLELRWEDFQFSSNGANQPQMQIGPCQGPAGLKEAIQTAVESSLSDAAWLQGLLRESLLSYAQGSLATLQSELLLSRKVSLGQGVDLEWHPEALQVVGQGLLRVQGQFVAQKQTPTAYVKNITRSYALNQLEQSQDSGFVLPKDAVPEILRFMYAVGSLRYRTSSDKIESFKSLMSNRFMQFFVWPDLMNFSSESNFVFDASPAQLPAIGNGVTLSKGGVAYGIQTSMRVSQWAVASRQYVPYVDFTGDLSGRLEAQVQDRQLNLKVLPSALNLTEKFRREFLAWRPVNPWMAVPLIASSVKNYLMDTAMTFNLPVWRLADGMELGIRDVEQRKQSFRVPLGFKNSK